MAVLSDNGKEYFGKPSAQASALRSEGRIWAPLAYCMLQRIGTGEEADWYMNNYFYTSDSIVVPSKKDKDNRGKFKLCLRSPRLASLNEASGVIHGRLALSSYDEISGEEFREDEHVLNRNLSRAEAKESKLWLYLLGGNQGFLEAVVDKIFDKGAQYNYDRMMGLCIPSLKNETHELPTCVGRLEYGSQLVGWDGLVDDNGRLVGLAPEALILSRFEQRVAAVLKKYRASAAERMVLEEAKAGERYASGIYTPDEVGRLEVVNGNFVLQKKSVSVPETAKKSIHYDYFPLEIESCLDGIISEDTRAIPLELPK